jgi:hypothetical protein
MCSYCYVPSCHAPKTAASLGPKRAKLIRFGEPPGMFDQGPGSLPRVVEGDRRDRQVVKSCVVVLIVGWISEGANYSQD